MFIQEFKKEFLSLDSIQFAVGLALDALGEYTPAQAVIALYRPDLSEKYVTKQYRNREELNRALLIRNKGLVLDFIEFLYSEDYLLRLNKHARVYANFQFVSLSTLLQNRVPVSVLYKETMRIILNNDANSFIYLYTHTKCFGDEFKAYMYREYRVADIKTGKNFSIDIINALRSSFSEYINLNSCTGAYHPSSCTPNNFLFAAMKWYMQDSSFFDILNARSQFGEISKGNNLNLLDYAHSDDEEISIDFMALASKITMSSYSLFNHAGDNGIAYYDIFSWYRDDLAHKLYQDNLSKLKKWFPGVEIHKATLLDGVSSTKRLKAGKRMDLCSKYNEQISKGVAVTEIFALYTTVVQTNYEQCTHVGESGSVSDGIPYYAYKSVSPRTTDNNADKFKKDYEGFLALKELVTFLNSASNNTGVTVFNMPVDVFRDKRLLRRYNSFSEYIMLDSDVRKLMSDVDSDAARSEAINARRIRNNDSIFTRLVSNVIQENERSSQLMGKLFNTKLSDGEQIVASNINQKSLADRLKDDTNRILTKWNTLRCVPGEAFSIAEIRKQVSAYENIADKIKLLLMYFNTVCTELKNTDIPTENKYSLCICGVNTLIVFLEVIKHPLLDEDGYYNLVDFDLNASLEAIHAPAILVQLINYVLQQTYSVFDLEKQGNWEDYRILFSSTIIMQDFLSRMRDLLGKLKRLTESDDVQKSGNNLYLVYADMIANYDILQMKWDVDQIRDLSIFYSGNHGLLPLDVSNKAIAFTVVERRRNRKVLHVLQKFLDLYGNDEREFLENLNTSIFATLSVTDSFRNETEEMLQKLATVNSSILLQNESNGYTQLLESKFQFDDNNFVVRGKNLVSVRTDLYVKYFHRYGYVVSFAVENMDQLQSTLSEMESEDYAQLVAQLG